MGINGQGKGEVMIKIINKRTTNYKEMVGFDVDRNSPVGNPFYLTDESERDAVCDAYEQYFHIKIKDESSRFFTYMQQLIDYYNIHGHIVLRCWCYPKRCHAETIKNYIQVRCGK
jgi:benzoyl-CoA reductase/2-hydroxyglutaryl-CoA dehydratase subunit BcrC/BadD/HgdB